MSNALISRSQLDLFNYNNEINCNHKRENDRNFIRRIDFSCKSRQKLQIISSLRYFPQLTGTITDIGNSYMNLYQYYFVTKGIAVYYDSLLIYVLNKILSLYTISRNDTDDITK